MLKRLILILAICVGCTLIAPTPRAEASDLGWSASSVVQGKTWSWSWSWSWKRWWRNFWSSRRGDDEREPTKKGDRGVPELDPTSAGSAMVLLLGGVAYIASRRREEEDTA